MTDRSPLGNRMKRYEDASAGQRHLPLLPVLARIDGKRFSRFTEGLGRPYDLRLSELMTRTAEHLVETTHARVGYTQSDEITLLFYSDDLKRQIFLDGRVQKQASILASMTTAWFMQNLREAIPEKAHELPIFDCRVWTVPTREEAANALLWRELDATKNSLGMASRHYYSHEELLGRSAGELHELLHARGVNWNDYPPFFKRGTFIQRRVVHHPYSPAERAELPPKHKTHRDPDLQVARRQTVRLHLPPLSTVRNRVVVLFDEADPVVGP